MLQHLKNAGRNDWHHIMAGLKIAFLSGKQQQESGVQINALFSLRMPRKMQHAEVMATLSTIDGIRSIEEL